MATKKQAAEQGEAKRRRAERTAWLVRPRPLTPDSGIFRLVGIGDSGLEGGFSWRKHDLERLRCGELARDDESADPSINQ
ncbi:MAG: hypothetical protein HYY04_04895 [Chloroflexi bacterium]|nr:hypothetical protein [Chloroflexota bacterium]